MRQLVRVVAATAALLGVLGLPAPVAAETAEQGQAIVLSQLGLPDLGLFGPDATAHLETPSLVKLGFTGVNPWDRTRAAKLADGSWRYQYEDVTTATGIPAARLEGVRSWVDAPYHRLPLMDANTRHIGCSVSERTVGGPHLLGRGPGDGRHLEGHHQADHRLPGQRPDRRAHLLQPLPGAPHPLRRSLRHVPPGPERRLRRHLPGRRLLRHEDPGHRLLPRLVRQPGGHPPSRPLPHHQVDRGASSVDTNLPINAAMLAATAPLAPQTKYNVRVSGYVQATKGGKWVQFKTRTWSFTTA